MVCLAVGARGTPVSHDSIVRNLSSRLQRLFCVGLVVTALVLCFAGTVQAQDNYEILVFGAETVPPKAVLLEMHSNYTVEGSKPGADSRFLEDGTFPTDRAVHETVQVVTGVTKWSEVGLYVFTSARDGQGVQWVGSHIRPAVRAPERWHLPVRLSLSNEFGYQRAQFARNTWTWEIRPVVDRQVGRWYFAVNPTMDRTWHGPGVRQGFTFVPSARTGYDVTRKINVGVEYYAAYGSFRGFDTLHDEHQQVFLATTLKRSKWEFNFGVGMGATGSTDHLIVKTMVARRFNWHEEGEGPEEPAGGPRVEAGGRVKD